MTNHWPIQDEVGSEISKKQVCKVQGLQGVANCDDDDEIHDPEWRKMNGKTDMSVSRMICMTIFSQEKGFHSNQKEGTRIVSSLLL